MNTSSSQNGLVFRRRKDAKLAAELARRHPDSPWLWRPAWADGLIPCSNKHTMIVAWCMCLFTVVISTPLALALPEEIFAKQNYLALLGLVFPAAGVGFLIWAVRSVVLWRKYGISVFRMDAVPGVLGGKLSGTVFTSTHLEPEDGFHVKLVCTRRRSTGSGSSRHSRETVLWQNEQTLRSDRRWKREGGSGCAIPISFNIPFSCEASNDSDEGNCVLWSLEVDAVVSGIDFDATFEVPVFKTEESRPEIDGLAVDLPEDGKPGDEDSDYRALTDAAGIDMRTTSAGGLDLGFAPGRHRGAAFGLTLFTLCWTGTIWLQMHLGAPFIFPLLTGLVDLLLILVALELWFGVSRTQVDRRGITVRNSIFGIGLTRFAAAGDVEAVQLHIGMQSNKTPYYDLRVVCRPVRRPGATREMTPKLIAGRHIKSKRLAEWLARKVEAVLEVSERQTESAS